MKLPSTDILVAHRSDGSGTSFIVKNAAGQYVAPTMESVTAAASGAAKSLPAATDYRVSIVNATGRDAYPISSFTWILVYSSHSDATKGKKLVDFLRWAMHEGEASAGSLDYAPLPANLVAQLERRLTTIKVGTVGMAK